MRFDFSGSLNDGFAKEVVQLPSYLLDDAHVKRGSGMSYNYQTEKPNLFTESGQIKFLEVRDKVKALLQQTGAFRMDYLSVSGDSWATLACVDRLVELKEIVPLRDKVACWGQYQVYADTQVHNY
jgi:hypothetical protein